MLAATAHPLEAVARAIAKLIVAIVEADDREELYDEVALDNVNPFLRMVSKIESFHIRCFAVRAEVPRFQRCMVPVYAGQ